jgi:hypothetical protein
MTTNPLRPKSDQVLRFVLDLRLLLTSHICVTFPSHVTSASAIEKGKWLEWRDAPERTDRLDLRLFAYFARMCRRLALSAVSSHVLVSLLILGSV